MKRFCSNCNKRTKTKKHDYNEDHLEKYFHTLMMFMTFGLWIIVIGIDEIMEPKYYCLECGKRIQ